jgi:hypothetical protein
LVSFSLSYLEGSGQPWIFLNPQSQAVTAGGNVTFSVGTSYCTPSVTPYGYQWRFQGSNLGGATDSSLALTNTQFYHAGAYDVIVYATPPWTGQSRTSSPALLTVLPSPLRPELRTGTGYGGLDGQGFHFTLLGQTGLVYRIETATDLVQWQELFWITNFAGVFYVTDPSVTGANARFYRAAQ